MTEEEIKVAQELVKHPNFRWAEGMVDPEGCFFFGTDEFESPVFWSPGTGMFNPVESVPDISHPATKGCLLALAREVSGVSDLHCENDTCNERRPVWAITSTLHLERVERVTWPYIHAILSDSEGIALARAIMEAPKQ